MSKIRMVKRMVGLLPVIIGAVMFTRRKLKERKARPGSRPL